MSALPFSAEELGELVKTAASLSKAARQELKVAKDAADAARAAAGDAEPAKGALKRRRTKGKEQ